MLFNYVRIAAFNMYVYNITFWRVFRLLPPTRLLHREVRTIPAAADLPLQPQTPSDLYQQPGE
jgi:hypothetical protein